MNNSKKIDFDAIKHAALGCFESLLAQWLPGGLKNGWEYVALNPTRTDNGKKSFSINIKSGVWEDFATGDKGGDPVSLYAYLFNLKNGEAAKALAQILGVSLVNPLPKPQQPIKEKTPWVAIIPPKNAPEPPKAHRWRGLPEKIWCYRDIENNPIGYLYRFKTSDGGKELIPLTWCRNSKNNKEEWRWKGFEVPRPLYCLDRLAIKPDASVLIVEGEKCADAANEQLPDLICLTWQGGSNASDKADWQPLAGKKVIIWADCDAQTDKSGVLLPESKQPGMKAAIQIAGILQGLGCRVWIVKIPKPGEKKHGWDIADAIAEGLAGDDLADFIRGNLQPFEGFNASSDLVPTSPIGVETVQPRRHTRQTLEKLIDETDGIDELVINCVMQVANSGLLKPLIEYLLAKIAKKAGVPKSSLVEVVNSYSDKPTADAGSDNDGWIDEINKNHAIVYMAGKTLIFNNEFDPVMKQSLFTFSTRNDFENRYCNRRVFHKGDDVGLGAYWFNHQRRREFYGLVFSPGEDVQGYLNLWTGWGVDPKAGCCTKYLEFVLDIICSGNQDLYNYIIFWCAHLVQRPQELPETALVFRGSEGIGKDTFIKPLKDIVGSEHFLMLTSLTQITGRFSGHLYKSILIYCNESVWGGDKSAQGVLKSMITDQYQPIEFKGKDLTMVKSYRRMIFATNENWAVPRGPEDRRYLVTDVSDSKKCDYEYFKAIRDELKSGGVEALMAYLLAWDISDWHPRDIPQNLQECGWELKIRSGGSVIQWWFDMLERGYFTKKEESTMDVQGQKVVTPGSFDWPLILPTEDVQKTYLQWCLDYRIVHPEHPVVIGRSLCEWGFKTSRPRLENPNRRMFYKIPSIEDARAIFSKRFSIPESVWAEHEEGQAFL